MLGEKRVDRVVPFVLQPAWANAFAVEFSVMLSTELVEEFCERLLCCYDNPLSVTCRQFTK